MKRRFICFILSICMIISFLSGFAGAEDPAAFTYTAGDGSITMSVSANLFQIGDATHAPQSDLTFENVHVYSDGAPFYLSYADGCKLTLDGGSFIAKTDSNTKQTIRFLCRLSKKAPRS